MKAIEAKTPIVVIKGSGRAADLIATAYFKYQKEEKKALTNLEADIISLLQYSDKDPKKQEKIEAATKALEKIVPANNLVTIYNIDDSEDTQEMDQAILKALLKANSNFNIEMQLDLARSWDCYEIARHDILNYENRSKWMCNKDLYSVLEKAIINDQLDFVQLLLDCEITLKDFLTPPKLLALYNDMFEKVTPSSQLIKRWKESFHRQGENTLGKIGKVIKALTSKKSVNIYKDFKSINGPDCMNGIIEYPERELFYFCLLFGQRDMAHFFWKLGSDPIGGALVGANLWQNLAKHAEYEEELEYNIKLTEYASEFESIALGVLNECYKNHQLESRRLLTRCLHQWGGQTLLMMADEDKHMEFMGHSCCQSLINQSWVGAMGIKTSHWLMFFPFLLSVPWITFTKNNYWKTSTQDKPCHYKVGLKSKDVPPDSNEGVVGIFTAIILYLSAPVVKFFYDTIFRLIYIGLFSFILLTNINPTNKADSPSAAEYLLWFWTFIYCVDEIILMGKEIEQSKLAAIAAYFTSMWHWLDLIFFIFFIIAIFLRLLLTEINFHWVRMCYLIPLILSFVRLLKIFFVHKTMGPKIIIMKGMISDLRLFIMLLAIFVVCYGVAAQVLLYPNSLKDWSIVYRVLYQPYYQLFGAVNVAEALGSVDGCTSDANIYMHDASVVRCPEKNWLVMVLLSIQLLLTNILLLNLLIAMFSYTFNQIQENSEKYWRYFRYSLIYEYYKRPLFVSAPFSIFSHLSRILLMIPSLRNQKSFQDYDEFRCELSDEDVVKLAMIEKSCMENHWIIRSKLLQEQLIYKMNNTSQKIEKMIEELAHLKESMILHKEINSNK